MQSQLHRWMVGVTGIDEAYGSWEWDGKRESGDQTMGV